MLEPPSLPAVTGWQKIVILFLAMDEESANLVLEQFSPVELALLEEAANSLPDVSADGLRQIVREFTSDFDAAQEFARSPSQVFELLATSSERGSGVIEVERSDSSGPSWSDAAAVDPEAIKPQLEKEHPQTAAFVLSQIDQYHAFSVMMLLDPEIKFDILRRTLIMRGVHPEVARVVESSALSFLGSSGGDSSGDTNRQLVADILNRMDADEREAIMGKINQHMPEDLAKLKRLLFSFEDIPTLDTAARATLFDSVPADQLVLALNGCDEAFVSIVLETLGQRARRVVEAELKSGKEPPADDIKAARQEIASLVLRLAQEGQLSLPTTE